MVSCKNCSASNRSRIVALFAFAAVSASKASSVTRFIEKLKTVPLGPEPIEADPASWPCQSNSTECVPSYPFFSAIAATRSQSRVVHIACHTGALARATRERLGDQPPCRVRNLSSSLANAWMSVLLSGGGPRVVSPIERNESMKLRRAR